MNGREPGECDQVYKDALPLIIPANEKRELRTMVVTPLGKRSIVTRTVIYNRTTLPATNYTANRNGLQYQLYKQTFTGIDQLAFGRATDSGTMKDFTLPSIKQPFAVVYQGYLQIDTTGVYNCTLLQNSPATYNGRYSKPGARLYIDGELVVDNDAPTAGFPKKAPVPLATGFHAIKLVYYDSRGNGSLQVTMARPGELDGVIPGNKLFY